MASKNNKVNGGFMVLLGKRVGDSVFMPILCQTTLGLGRQLNTIDASSKCGKDIAIDEEDGTVTMEGFMLKAGLTDILTSKDVEDLYNTQDEADFMIGVVDPAGKSGAVSYRFSGVITQKQLTMNNNEKSKSSITITTTTPVETGVILPSGAILWDSDAKTSGYTFDWGTFFSSLDADLPGEYQAEAELLLAPGISQTGKVAGLDKNGNLVEFTATRAGTATYFGKDGLLKTAAANESRVDYSTGMPMRLVESSASNLALYSRKLSMAPWASGTGGTTICTDNAANALDGTKTASVLNIIAQGVSTFYAYVVGALPVGTYTASFYVMPGTKKSGYIYRVYDNNAKVDMVGRTDYSNQLIDGKYVRISIPFTVVTGQELVSIFITTEANSIIGTYTVDGFQIENGAVATSLMPTNGAIAVRAADVFTPVSWNKVADNGSLFVHSNSRYTSMSVLIKDLNNRTLALVPGKTQSISKSVATTLNSLSDKAASSWGGSSLQIANKNGLASGAYTSGSFVGSNTWMYGQVISFSTIALFGRSMTGDELKALTK